MKLLLVACVLSLLSLPAVPVASSQHTPLVDAQAFEQPAWVAYRIRTPHQGSWSAQIAPVVRDAYAYGFGVWVFLAGAGSAYLVTVGWSNSSPQLYVSTSATGPVADLGRPTVSRDEDWYRPGWTFDGSTGSEAVVVFVATASGEMEGSFEIRGDEGTEVLSMTSGTDAELLLAPDFEAQADVIATIPASVPFVTSGQRVEVMAGGERTLSIGGRLFGWFRPGEGSSYYEGPSGAETDRVLTAKPAGDHRFVIEGSASNTPISLMYADVTYPSFD